MGRLNWYPYVILSRLDRISCETFHRPSFDSISHPGRRACRTRRTERRHARPCLCRRLRPAGQDGPRWLARQQQRLPGRHAGRAPLGMGLRVPPDPLVLHKGWQYEYVSGTFSELMDMLEAGEIDLMPNISYSAEREQKLLFSSNPEAPSATISTPGPTATIWPRVTLRRSKASPSAATLALCKLSSASSGSPTKTLPAPIKKSTPAAPL